MSEEPQPPSDPSDLADALYLVMPILVAHVNERLETFGMTYVDYWALRTVDAPMPMKDLASCMDVDPSYVTSVADRLEQLGFIERRPHPSDRRVKNLVCTKAGERMKKEIPRTLWKDPNTFSSLSADERQALALLLAKLAGSAEVA